MNAHMSFHDGEERRRWQNPEAILTEIGLRSGHTFMDIGCGEGFFTIPAAKLVGQAGKVYAIDANPYAISSLRGKAADEGLGNIVTTVGMAEDTVLCEACADMVFLSLVLHDFKDPNRVLLNAKKMVKATGVLVDLDWKKEPMDLGPPLRIRFSEEEATRRTKEAGFRVDEVKDSGLYHYLIVARAAPLRNRNPVSGCAQ